MDEKNKAAPAAMPARAVSKSEGQYRNAHWDLVDAVKEGKVDLKKVDAKDLPADMQKMDAETREKHVRDMLARRESISKRIGELNKQRLAFIKEDRAKNAKGQQSEQTLGDALIAAIDKQAADEGYEFEK